jgi:hypothetical protein
MPGAAATASANMLNPPYKDKFNKSSHHKQKHLPQRTQRAQRNIGQLILRFFLGVLSDLRGEMLLLIIALEHQH